MHPEPLYEKYRHTRTHTRNSNGYRPLGTLNIVLRWRQHFILVTSLCEIQHQSCSNISSRSLARLSSQLPRLLSSRHGLLAVAHYPEKCLGESLGGPLGGRLLASPDTDAVVFGVSGIIVEIYPQWEDNVRNTGAKEGRLVE